MKSKQLMANCMIYYNAKLLNAILVKLQKDKNEKLIDQLKYISPVAWIHINLYGYYSFEELEQDRDMNKLAGLINVMKLL